jgi:drug/metabolite transporter (DMT)-like permease
LWFLIYPLLASFCIAAWILVSNYLRKMGMDSIKLSISYDSFAFVALLLLFSRSLGADFKDLLAWKETSANYWSMILFSLVIGWLPNYLFYLGSRNVQPHFVGMLMALEPLFSALYSSQIWGFPFNGWFFFGATLVLLANLPRSFWKRAMIRNGRTAEEIYNG